MCEIQGIISALFDFSGIFIAVDVILRPHILMDVYIFL